jgi:CheY-like chemotaxis protein/HAMP domain-containing protein
VTTAVAAGDLSRKITVEAKGEIFQLKDTINLMVDQLNAFSAEVTRVAREVGAEGKLGGQAEVKGVSGVWKNLTDSVNGMAGSLTSQVRDITKVTTAVANGDLSQKITVEARGEILELKDTINRMADQLNAFATEVTRVAREVGTEGKLGGQAYVRGVSGVWKDLTDNVNRMASNLTDQVRNIALVTTAVATGDLSQKITVEAQGEILQLKSTINKMVDQLNAFASEVSRVAREVGTEGKLGGQAYILGALGVWKDLTDNVNRMGTNLTDQVRNIAVVTTAVANGDLSRKITVEARGEILQLKETINQMVDQLNAFAGEVTRVAREVGGEGKLGGQAQVRGVSGVWKDLTDNVNGMASNLTTQVRAIAEVATAVTKGDLSRSIAVEAKGEVAELKDNVNQMISTLKDTTQRNEEQDWLKTNLARFTRMLQGQRNLETVAQMIMSELTPLVNAQHGVFYVAEKESQQMIMKLLSSYAYTQRKNVANQWHSGEGLVGQAAFEKKPIVISNVPADYVKVTSGLGEGTPLNIAVLPVIFEGQVMAVVELASFNRFSETYITFLEQLMESMGVVINMILGTMRTEDLLKQSQSLAEELQNQQEELKRSNEELGEQTSALKKSQELLQQQRSELQRANEELEEKAVQIDDQRKNVEVKNAELELTQATLAERAEQLAITSKYKSEFLANMSHELRTPLNSMLLLSKLVSENKEGNLTDKQMEYVKTVHAGGVDLLNLINEILDLSKIEAGKMEIGVSEFGTGDITAAMERSFKQLAEQKGLVFEAELQEGAPEALRTDRQRLEQVLRNLLSNAFKFTEKGRIALTVKTAKPDRRFESATLRSAGKVIAFAVSDTGIGIPGEKQKIIWEAFQQVDGTTSRKYGGTGLGLTISREIARILGGEIHLESEEEKGSTFTLYLPETYTPLTGPEGGEKGPEAPPEPPQPEKKSLPKAQTVPVEMIAESATALATQDDRYAVQPGDRMLLIIEDDAKFAGILADMAHDRGFKVLWADKGDTGLALAHEFMPDGIILDIMLPVMDGWTVLERIKSMPELRHIPVHIISVVEDRKKGLQLGAIAYLTKPVSKESLDNAFSQIEGFLSQGPRRLLVAEDNAAERKGIKGLIGNGDVIVTAVATGAETLEALKKQHFDCMILDLKLPDMDGFTILKKMWEELEIRDLPVIVYTGMELTPEETVALERYAHTIIIKGEEAPARLLDETALFLHRVEAKLPKEKQTLIRSLHEPEEVFKDRRILIVDDDMRNIFALTSVLETRQMKICYAENGRDGIAVLKANPDVDLILMDIMMPEMDGYETIRQIRQDDRFKTLPIIALTAKAMKGDREKCIIVGASDYISKPVNIDQLLSLMRVWMYKH